MNKLLIVAALAMGAIAADRKACIEIGKADKANKVRFMDDAGKKHTLTLVDLGEDDASVLLTVRASAGQYDSKEVIIETSEHKLVSLGKVDSVCVSKVRSQIVMR